MDFYVNDKSLRSLLVRVNQLISMTVSPGNFFTDDFSIATLTDNKQTKIEKAVPVLKR